MSWLGPLAGTLLIVGLCSYFVWEARRRRMPLCIRRKCGRYAVRDQFCIYHHPLTEDF